jgi:hypothetical protein
VEYSHLINERKFASAFSGFWREALPFAEAFVRRANLASMRSGPPVQPTCALNRRALVGELAFRSLCEQIASGTLRAKDRAPTAALLADTALYMHYFEEWPNDVTLPDAGEVAEAQVIARSLAALCRSQGWTTGLLCRPPFPGCGIVQACEADIIVGELLLEVKVVDRGFRAVDFRQVLTYLALGHAAQRYGLRQIAIVNPRRGRWFRISVADLCLRLSGGSETDLLGRIASYVSSVDEAQ